MDRLPHVFDAVEAAGGLWDAGDTFATWREQFKVTATDGGVVAVLVQRTKGHQGVSDGRRVENVIEGEGGLVAAVRHVDGEGTHPDGREPLLVHGVEVDWRVKYCVGGEIRLVRGDVSCCTQVV